MHLCIETGNKVKKKEKEGKKKEREENNYIYIKLSSFLKYPVNLVDTRT